MLAGPRLRQVALAAADCHATASQLKMTFGWPEPFHHPGVSRFGLTNVAPGRGEGITEVRLTTGRPGPAVQIGGVRFVPAPPAAGGQSP